MKECFKCLRSLPLGDFYKHRQMADGHLNKCKACAKKDATLHRNNNIEAVRAYDRERGARQGKAYSSGYRSKFPQKYKAQTMVGNAIRDGRLFKEPCSICGSTDRGNAHHDDYLRPLNVRWLCSAHHHQWHRDNGPGLNG